jgi:uncharacterized membrane protein
MSLLALELKKIDGIPLHPLVVHIPVVFVPLALIGTIVALVRPKWRQWCLPLTAVLAGISLVGVQIGIMSGEGLEEILNEESAAIERHSQLAEQSRPFVFLFFVFCTLAAAAWYATHRRHQEEAAGAAAPVSGARATLAKLLVPFLALSVVTGALSTVWIYRTGHSGAKSAWGDAGKEGGDEGRGEDGKKADADRKPDADKPAGEAPAPDGDTDGD